MSNLQSKPSDHTQELLQKRKFWSRIIADWKNNPISPRQFCKAKGLTKEHFYYWRRKIDNDVADTGGFIEVPAPAHDSGAPTIETTKRSANDQYPASVEVIVPNGIKLIIKLPVSAIGEVINQFGGVAC